MFYLQSSRCDLSLPVVTTPKRKNSAVFLQLKQFQLFHPHNCEYLYFTCSLHQLVPLLCSANTGYSPVFIFSDTEVFAIIQKTCKFKTLFSKKTVEFLVKIILEELQNDILHVLLCSFLLYQSLLLWLRSGGSTGGQIGKGWHCVSHKKMCVTLRGC
jgi:hypothetical protein